MLKKAIWSIVLIAIVGVLIYGAVNRTLAKTIDSDTSSESASLATNHNQATEIASSLGQGRGQAEKTGAETDHAVDGESHGRQGQNTTSDSGARQGQGRGQNRQVEPNDAGVGEAEQAGQGYGRQGQNATSGSESWQGKGNGRGQNRQAEQAGAGNAEAEHANMEWQTVQGEVVSLASDAMIVETTSGASVLVEGRSWSYAQQAGFVAELGDAVTLNGFEEDGEFKVGELANDASGQLVQIRELSGRPLWAGGGQGRSH